MQRTIKDFDDSTIHIQSRQNGAGSGVDVLEQQIDRLLQREYQRLQKEYGIDTKPVAHAHRSPEHPFTVEQRAETTVLFGGLTWKHERLIEARLRGLGYTCRSLPVPDVKAFQTGKEFGNNGQCNPTYFTVGNLINYLRSLEDSGMSREEIIAKYVFFTAGACGPCRFGMYENEYRMALRNSGFEGFRVLLFQQTGGLNQIDQSAGLEMNLDFFLGIINAIIIGDLLNDIAYQIRPYEIGPGTTDAALEEAILRVERILETQEPFTIGESGVTAHLGKTVKSPLEQAGKYINQLFGKGLVRVVEECREIFRTVKVDRTRVKPIVKVTGEFWAQTTEGDGNFNMFAFLERENAQVLVEPVGTWLMYMLHQVKQEIRDRKYIGIPVTMPPLKRALRKLVEYGSFRKSDALFTLGELLFLKEYNKIRAILNNLPPALTNQYEMQRIAHPYYNSRVEGGEGHLEIAKNIYYSSKNLCHMVLSLKPFGCMPSSQSDGVQSAVTSHYKDIIYLPIETSGEGEINAHSRVQMALADARTKAKSEYAQVLETFGITTEEVREYVSHHQELADPFYSIPKQKHLAGVAANFVWHVAARMGKQVATVNA